MRQKVTSKEQILDAAMDIAIKEGVDQLSIRKLAKACQIAVGSMYNYYPDKETLVLEVAEVFWDRLLKDQEKLYRRGMDFTTFLEQYYSFLSGRLAHYDTSWLTTMNGRTKKEEALQLFLDVLRADRRVDPSIWNMELNEEALVEYVFVNLTALLQAGENNCRFFIFLLEHLLYDV